MKFKNLSKKMLSIIKTLSPLAITVAVFVIFGGEGLLSLFILMMIYSIYRAWKARESIVAAMKSIEIIIFGKPLEKGYWKKNELKNTKVKLVWRKKKSQPKK